MKREVHRGRQSNGQVKIGIWMNRAGSARGNEDIGYYPCWIGAGAPPVCCPWRNRASGIPLVNQLGTMIEVLRVIYGRITEGNAIL